MVRVRAGGGLGGPAMWSMDRWALGQGRGLCLGGLGDGLGLSLTQYNGLIGVGVQGNKGVQPVFQVMPFRYKSCLFVGQDLPPHFL